MALTTSSNATVATGMSPIVEGALYADPILIDGVTFTSKHEIGNAGQIQVVVSEAPASALEPKLPGSDFSDKEYANKVVDINCNNAFSESIKVPNYFGASMPINVMADKSYTVTETVRVGRQSSALAVLASGGTASANTTAITADNVKATVVGMRKDLRKKHVHPDVCFCSVDAFSAVLEYAGKDFFYMFNDDIARSGKIGMWLGMLFIECDSLDGVSTYKYLDASGTAQSVDISDVEMIMYDHEKFSIIDRLDTLRLIQSEHFNGSKVQEELSCGFLVTNSKAVLVKKKAA